MVRFAEPYEKEKNKKVVVFIFPIGKNYQKNQYHTTYLE